MKKIKQTNSFDDINEFIIKNDIQNSIENFDLSSYIEPIIFEEINLNNSDKFLDNKCYCCKNYLIIHELLQYKFIEKYKKNKEFLDDNIPQQLPSKYIKMLFRLKPKLFSGLNLENYKYLDSLKYNYYINNDNLSFLFETYFYQPNISYDDYIICTICLKNYCPKHTILNEFFMKKCNCCSKYWNICAWCKNDYLFEQFDCNNKIIDEYMLCSCFHEQVLQV